MTATPWACPVCGAPLTRRDAWLQCDNEHSFDVAREGYVNLLVAGRRRSRAAGDSKEMVDARHRFLATGAYDRVTTALGHVVARLATRTVEHTGQAPLIVDVGCGDGHHTRRIGANVASGSPGLDPVPALLCGIDVSKRAVAVAARADPSGWYAVASASHMPLATASADIAMNVFGPIAAEELARVVRPGGTVVAAHPGPEHLDGLRALVYREPRPTETKGPLRHAPEFFPLTGRVTVTFPLLIDDATVLHDLFAMTPYRWHGPVNIEERLAQAAADGFTTMIDVVISTYARADHP